MSLINILPNETKVEILHRVDVKIVKIFYILLI